MEQEEQIIGFKMVYQRPQENQAEDLVREVLEE